MLQDELINLGSYVDGIASHSVSFSQSKYQEPLSWEKYGISCPESIKNACLKRKVEYLAGRYCAKKAMNKIGFNESEFQLRIGNNRAPIWPNNLIGSISHSNELAICIVSSAESYRGIGLDVESSIKSTSLVKIKDHISLNTECVRFERDYSKAMSESTYFTLLFSAKESIYKAINPLAGKFFGFQDAEISEVNVMKSEFTFVLKTKLNSEFSAGFTGKGRFFRRNLKIISVTVI